MDGSSTIGKRGAGIVLNDPKDAEIEYAVHLGFGASNNEAEYEALIHGLEITAKNGVEELHLFFDIGHHSFIFGDISSIHLSKSELRKTNQNYSEDKQNEKAKLESLGCMIGKGGNNFTSMNKSSK